MQRFMDYVHFEFYRRQRIDSAQTGHQALHFEPTNYLYTRTHQQKVS